jgi:hypothetical protein
MSGATCCKWSKQTIASSRHTARASVRCSSWRCSLGFYARALMTSAENSTSGYTFLISWQRTPFMASLVSWLCAGISKTWESRVSKIAASFSELIGGLPPIHPPLEQLQIQPLTPIDELSSLELSQGSNEVEKVFVIRFR